MFTHKQHELHESEQKTNSSIRLLFSRLKRFYFGFAFEMSKNADRSRKSTGKYKVIALDQVLF
jgi:hypothetical protein